MSRVVTFEVRFTRDPPMFRSGENVTGAIAIVTDGPLQARELFVHIKGEGNNSWLNKTTEQALGFRQMYIDRVVDLPPPAILEASAVEMPFSIPLPLDFPSSIEGEWGFIRYSIKAVMELRSAEEGESKLFGSHTDSFTHSANFDVVKSFDLRLDVNHAR